MSAKIAFVEGRGLVRDQVPGRKAGLISHPPGRIGRTETTMVRLNKQPGICIKTIAELVGVASAIGADAIRRYDWLATEMRRRGQASTAEAFEVLAAEENSHLSAVETWARGLGVRAPVEDFSSHLPDDLTRKWKEASQSALLTPYRAYSIAVDNEARAFAFYTYLAASAADGRIAREAEHLALEKLQHAATLRTWRRAAWRSERQACARHARTAKITSPAELESIIGKHEGEIAYCHERLAARLRDLEDTEGADLLEKLADTARARGEVTHSNGTVVESYRADHPLALVLAAQVPLERFCETLDAVLLTTPSEETRARTEKAMKGAIARIGQLARHAEKLEQSFVA